MALFDDANVKLDVLKKRAYNYRWAEVGEGVIPLTAADPDYPVAPEIRQAMMDYIQDGYFSYTLEQRGLNPAACAQTNSISGLLNAASCGLGAALFFDASYLMDDPMLTWREVPNAEIGIHALYSLKSGNFLRFLGCLQLCVEAAIRSEMEL